MAYELKDKQGSLFANDKQKDNHPDLKGRININGHIYELAGWKRTSQNGKEYISLKASEPRQADDLPDGNEAF